MKKKTFIITIVLLAIMVFSLAGCSMVQSILDVPENLHVENGVAKWNSVDGASKYLIFINGNEEESPNTSFDLSSLNLVNGQTYTVKVKAVGDGYIKLSSDYSEEITFVYYKNASSGNDNNISSEKEELNDEVVDSIVNSTDSNSTYYGIGRTINVITDEYANFTAESIGYGKVFDPTKLASLNWYRQYVGDMESETYTGSSMEKFYINVNADFKQSFSAGASYGNVFSAGLENSFGFSAGVEYENTANEIYHMSSQYFGANLVAIDEYYNINQFQNVLSESFLSDISALENGTKSAEQIVRNYGTHAVLAGYYGGKISCYSYIRNTSTKWDVNTAFKYESSVNAALGKLVSAGSSTSISLAAQLGMETGTTSENFTARAIGGANFKALSLEDYLSNYGSWVDSMNNMSVEKSVIVGLPARSLVSLWDVIPSEYTNAKAKLSSYFNNQVETSNSAFLEKYERHYNAPVEPVYKNSYINTTSLSCKQDNGFNHTQPDTRTDIKYKHDHFEFGKFYVTNTEVSGNTLKMKKGATSSINFFINYDTTNLPIAGNVEKSFIFDDYTEKTLYNLPYNVGAKQVGYGLIVATVDYNDGSPQRKILLEDAFKEKGAESVLTIIDSNLFTQNCTVNISVLYEIKTWGPSSLKSDDFWTNWRINQTFYVEVE